MKQPSTPPPPVMCNWCGANLEHEEHYPHCKGVAPHPDADLVRRLREQARHVVNQQWLAELLREAADALSVRDFAPAGEIKHWSEPR